MNFDEKLPRKHALSRELNYQPMTLPGIFVQLFVDNTLTSSSLLRHALENIQKSCAELSLHSLLIGEM